MKSCLEVFWHGGENKGVIKLFLLVYATFVSGKYHLDI